MKVFSKQTIAIALLVLSPCAAWATVVHVGPSQAITTVTGGYNAATNGDVILIDDGIYNETLVVNKEVTFQAANIGGAVIDAQGGGSGYSVFDVRADSTFIGLHIRNTTAGINIRQNANVEVRVERVIASDFSGAAFSIGNPSQRVGKIDVFNSLVLDSTSAAGINDGDQITLANTIVDNVGTGYVIHNGNAIMPNSSLFHNVTQRGSASADPNEIVADPLFVDRAGGDYHLQAGSQAIDSGVDVGLPFLGSAPDRGPFEFDESMVPEPSSWAVWFLALGLVRVHFSRRRRQMKRRANVA